MKTEASTIESDFRTAVSMALSGNLLEASQLASQVRLQAFLARDFQLFETAHGFLLDLFKDSQADSHARLTWRQTREQWAGQSWPEKSITHTADLIMLNTVIQLEQQQRQRETHPSGNA